MQVQSGTGFSVFTGLLKKAPENKKPEHNEFLLYNEADHLTYPLMVDPAALVFLDAHANAGFRVALTGEKKEVCKGFTKGYQAKFIDVRSIRPFSYQREVSSPDKAGVRHD